MSRTMICIATLCLVILFVALSIGGCSRAADRTLTICQFQSTDTYHGQFQIDTSQLPSGAVTRTDSGGAGDPVTSLKIDMKYPIQVVLVPYASDMANAVDDAENNYKPKDGYVPDADTAITIAVAVWNPIFGKDQIANEKPYKTSLSKGIWTVEGSLPEGMVGGVAEAEISKDDGRIVRVIHGK
jgi:hypothetical protein